MSFVKIVLTKHVLGEKIPKEKALGWNITQSKIRQTIQNPKWKGVTRLGQPTAMSLLDLGHILRVIFEKEGDIIRVITVHIARRGTYESTKED